MNDLVKELNDVKEAVRTRLPNESPVDQALRIANESAEAVGTVVAKFDEVNADADYIVVRREVGKFASDIAMELDIPWNMDVLVPMLASLAVDKLKEYNGNVGRLRTEYIKPLFAAFKEFGERGLASLES